jgi:hypothetical protein
MPVAHAAVIPRQNNNIPIAVVDPAPGPGPGPAPEDFVCPICFGGPDDQDPIKTLPCRHKFHKSCINQWGQTQFVANLRKNCPLCRDDYRGGKRKRKRRPRTRKKKAKSRRLNRRKSSRRVIRRKKGKTKRKRKKRKH